MGTPDAELQQLRAENAQLRAEVERLRAAAAGQPAQQQPEQQQANGGAAADGAACASPDPPSWDGMQHGLDQGQIARYSRQIILPSFGVQGAAASWAEAAGRLRRRPGGVPP